MKILVTGGVGFIGTNLVKKLITMGKDITSIDNYSTGLKKNEIKGVKYIKSDIELIDKIDTEFDLCFHLAAQSRVQPSFENPEESIRVNVNGTTKVMEWAKKHMPEKAELTTKESPGRTPIILIDVPSKIYPELYEAITTVFLFNKFLFNLKLFLVFQKFFLPNLYSYLSSDSILQD